MAEVKIAAASGGGSISIKGPSSSGSDTDLLDTSGNLTISGNSTLTGNVGIGVSAAKKLHVKGSADMFRLETTDGTGNCTMTFWDASAQKAYFGFGSGSSETFYIANQENADIHFQTHTSEKMRLTAAGFLKAKGDYSGYVSDTDNSHEFNGDTSGYTTMKVRAGSSNGNGIQCLVNSDDTGNYYFGGRSMSADSARMYIWSNGDVDNNNNSYSGMSDIKLKENIVDASSQWNDIKNLKVRKFNFKDNPNKPMIGLIAQEAETVSPGLVDSHPDTDAAGDDLGTTTKSVKYSILYMKAIKALQEAMAKIETLETKVAALEAG